MTPANFDRLASLLAAGSGLVIGPEKLYLLENRLGPLLARHGLSNLDALAGRICPPRAGSPPGALEQDVIEAMTTNESLFFRDEKPFAHLRTHALPRLLADRPVHAPLRIWSAAASTGQEAYSIAMTLADSRAALGSRSVEILGTDIAQAPLARAQEGLYTQFEVQRGLPMQSLVKHFRKDGPNWQISSALRAMVRFRTWNLLADLRPLGVFDIVFCRNVLIYFDQPTKRRVLEAIAQQLAPDGVLYLGGAETVLGITDAFVLQPEQRGVYQRQPAPGTTAQAIPPRAATGQMHSTLPPRTPTYQSNRSTVGSQ